MTRPSNHSITLRRGRQISIDNRFGYTRYTVECRPVSAAQPWLQQIIRTSLLLSLDGTYRRTDARPLLRRSPLERAASMSIEQYSLGVLCHPVANCIHETQAYV